jgi:Cu-processing system permease protein
MNVTLKVLRYELSNVLRGRWIIAYAVFFLVLGDGLLRFGGDDGKAILSLVNVVLYIVPLVSLVFGAMYLYGSREFNELLLAQPVRRSHLFAGLYLGVALPLAAAVAAGVSLPFVIHGTSAMDRYSLVAWVAATGALLTLVFVAIAFWIALRVDDRARGLGLALFAWLGLAVIYDGLVLAIVTLFDAWPLERPVLALILLNPIDLARILLLLELDVSALMGYTGAVFRRFFGTSLGLVLSVSALLAWAALPLWRGSRRFADRDF